MIRINRGMIQIKNLYPKDFKLEDLDEELVCIAMIQALWSEFDFFACHRIESDCQDTSKGTQTPALFNWPQNHPLPQKDVSFGLLSQPDRVYQQPHQEKYNVSEIHWNVLKQTFPVFE